MPRHRTGVKHRINPDLTDDPPPLGHVLPAAEICPDPGDGAHKSETMTRALVRRGLAALLVLAPALWGGSLIGTVLPWSTAVVEGTVAAAVGPSVRRDRSGTPTLWIWSEEQSLPYRLRPGFFASLGPLERWPEAPPGARLRVLLGTSSRHQPEADPRGDLFVEVLEARADGQLLVDIFPVVLRRIAWGLALIGLALVFWRLTAKSRARGRLLRQKLSGGGPGRR